MSHGAWHGWLRHGSRWCSALIHARHVVVNLRRWKSGRHWAHPNWSLRARSGWADRTWLTRPLSWSCLPLNNVWILLWDRLVRSVVAIIGNLDVLDGLGGLWLRWLMSLLLNWLGASWLLLDSSRVASFIARLLHRLLLTTLMRRVRGSRLLVAGVPLISMRLLLLPTPSCLLMLLALLSTTESSNALDLERRLGGLHPTIHDIFVGAVDAISEQSHRRGTLRHAEVLDEG